MCTTAIITGIICLLTGFVTGRLSVNSKKTEKPTESEKTTYIRMFIYG